MMLNIWSRFICLVAVVCLNAIKSTIGSYNLKHYELPETYSSHCSNLKNAVEYNWTRCEETDYINLTPEGMKSRSILWLKETLQAMKEGTYTSASNLNTQRLRKVLQKIERGENMTMFTFGGSLTNGLHVKEAYPERLELALKERYARFGHDTSAIRLVKRAVGGTSTEWLLNHISGMMRDTEISVDLITIEYDVNDCMKIEHSDQSRLHYEDITEAVIRTALELSSTPAILWVNIAITHNREMHPYCHVYHSCYSMGEIRRPVLEAYEVPIISQKLAVWANFNCPPPSWTWGCKGFCAHCDEKGHQILSDLLYGFLTGESFFGDRLFLDYFGLNITAGDNIASSTAVNITYPTQPLLNLTATIVENHCFNHFATAIGVRPDASPDFAKHHVNHSSVQIRSSDENLIVYQDKCWKYYEDVPQKPGWIVDDVNCFGASIVFNVTFGAHPFLNFEYLSTYDNRFGIVSIHAKSLSVDGQPTPDAQWNGIGVVSGFHGEFESHHYSMTEVFVFQSHPDAANQLDRHHHEYIVEHFMRPHSQYLLNVTLSQPQADFDGLNKATKFKLTSITTC